MGGEGLTEKRVGRYVSWGLETSERGEDELNYQESGY